MNKRLTDIALLGSPGAIAWALFKSWNRDATPASVCAECGHYGDAVQHAWSRRACACCGSKLLVSPDSPMAAGYWQSPQRKN